MFLSGVGGGKARPRGILYGEGARAGKPLYSDWRRQAWHGMYGDPHCGQTDTNECHTVADPGWVPRGPWRPPSPVQISHKKDGRQRRPHRKRFHVSWPPPTRPLDPMLHDDNDRHD